MIKLIIFDLDGVLVDAKEIHYNALNTALRNVDKKYVIQRDEHLSTYFLSMFFSAWFNAL